MSPGLAGAPYRIHRLPVDLIDRIALDDGRAVIVRPVLPQDAAATRAFVAALSSRSRYRRFHVGLSHLPDALLEGLTQVDHDRHVALVAQPVGEEAGALVAEARYVRRADSASAEFALVVADEWQGQGLGRRLLQSLARHAARQGVKELHGDILHDNEAMLRLVRQLDARLGTSPGGQGLLRARFVP